MFKYTVTKENLANLENVLCNLPKVGAEWFQTKPYNRIEVEEVDRRYELDSGQVNSLARTLLKFRKVHPEIKTDLLPLCYEFLVDENLPVESLSPCNCGKGPSGYLVISPTGDVRICGAYPDPIGNIKTDTITDLWQNHPLLKEVRNLANRPIPIECQDCSHWEKCAVTDCHSATYAKYRNYEHGNPQCPRITKML